MIRGVLFPRDLAQTDPPNKSVQQHLRVGQKTHLRTMEVPEMGLLGTDGLNEGL